MTYLVYTCTSSRHFFEKSYFNIFLKSRFKSRTCFLTSVEARADIVVLVVVVVDSGIASGAAGQPSGEMGIPLTHIADEVRGRSIFLALRRLSLFFFATDCFSKSLLERGEAFSQAVVRQITLRRLLPRCWG